MALLRIFTSLLIRIISLDFTMLAYIVGLVFLVTVVTLGWLGYRTYFDLATNRAPQGSSPWNNALKSGTPPADNTYTATDLAGCKSILASNWTTEADNRHRGPNQITPLEARAGPNRRLVEVFGINNLFTTIDSDYKRSFGREIRNLLRANNEDWKNIAASATTYLGWHLQLLGEEDVPLVQLIRTTTFRAVLDHFFASEIVSRDREAIILATENINEIWMMSKTQQSSSGKKTLEARRRDLQNALKKILPQQNVGSKAKDNPLNIILPSYETMWRVTFHCVTEMLRRSSGNITLKTMFDNTTREFLKDIDLDVREDGKRLPMGHPVNESLRLYPPTKRVYRWRQDRLEDGSMSEHCTRVAADIEAMQRDTEFWREHPEEWDPHR